jgi:hypothetical protein
VSANSKFGILAALPPVYMLSRKSLLRLVFLLLTLLAIYGLFSGSSEPIVGPLKGTWLERHLYALHNGNSIVFNLSVGYLVSVFFWLLVVYFPERTRRRVLRDNLSRRYHQFKEDTLQILLWSSIGTHDSTLPGELCDHRRFREFFDANEKQHWYAARNGLQGDKARLSDLLLELELLATEVGYVLNNVSIEDPKVHSFFKRLQEHMYRLRNASVYSYDPVKYLGTFLWEIHARWSIITGSARQMSFRR